MGPIKGAGGGREGCCRGGGTGKVIDLYFALDWAMGALLAFGAAFVALRYFKLSPLWALTIGMIVFTGLHFPLQTHAARVGVPRNSN